MPTFASSWTRATRRPDRAAGDLVRERYERKRDETGDPEIGILERLVLLRVIDTQWVEHLTAVDDMRRGIGLRAYSQREPLNEFKIEAYRMFDELKSTIRHDVTHTIFRVSPPAAASTTSRAHGPQRHRGPGRGRGRRPPRPARRRDRRRRRWNGAARGANRTEDRPQRSVLVRLGQEVQALPRGLVRPRTDGGRGEACPPSLPDGTDRTGCEPTMTRIGMRTSAGVVWADRTNGRMTGPSCGVAF